MMVKGCHCRDSMQPHFAQVLTVYILIGCKGNRSERGAAWADQFGALVGKSWFFCH